jgi:hypothetical protein
VPVSEDNEIVISGVKISPEAKPDSKGILRWPLALKPKDKQRFEIQYEIEYPPTLVLEMKRERAGRAAATPAPAPAPAAAAPAIPKPAPPRGPNDLKRDIQELEEML